MTFTPSQVRVYGQAILKRYGEGVAPLEILLDDVEAAAGGDDEDRKAMLDYITDVLNDEYQAANPAAERIAELRQEVEQAQNALATVKTTLTNVGKDYASEKLTRRKAESSLASVRVNLDGVTKNLNAVTTELAGVKINLKSVTLDLTNTRTKLAEAEAKITTTEGNVTTARAALKTEQEAHAATKGVLATTAAELAASKLQIQDLLKKLGLGGILK